MTGKDLISAIAEKTGMKKVEVEKTLDAFKETIVDALKKDDQVVMLNFGTFSVGNRSARTSINPATKEKIDIPARKVGKFKFSNTVNKQLL